MKKGRVYWITGLPGSGKTTIGTTLYYKLREVYDNIIILDGDILKQFVGDTVGYTTMDRIARAKKYSNICKILSDQGMWVIICTVAMFDSIREWNRMNIDGYVEVFLDVPLEVLKKRNKKDLYSGADKEMFEQMELPKNPDLVLANIEEDQVKKSVEKIIRTLPQSISDYDRDRIYWNRFYSGKSAITEPSDFAKDVIEDISVRGGELLELGCGNGRDSIFFMKKGLRVTAVDASDSVIQELQRQTLNEKITFICDDFVKCEALFQIMYDSIYSRFTLHAINEKQENELLKNIRGALKKKGKLYIEARTVHDDLFGKGEQVAHNAFVYNDHFRRFVDKDELCKKMERMGFLILSVMEDRGFSKIGNQDPVLLRLIAGVA